MTDQLILGFFIGIAAGCFIGVFTGSWICNRRSRSLRTLDPREEKGLKHTPAVYVAPYPPIHVDDVDCQCGVCQDIRRHGVNKRWAGMNSDRSDSNFCPYGCNCTYCVDARRMGRSRD